MSLAQGNSTPTRPRIEPGSPDPETDALTTRPVRSPRDGIESKYPSIVFLSVCFPFVFSSHQLFYAI